MSDPLSTVDYAEPTPPIRRGCHRRDRLSGKRGLDQIGYRPDPIRNVERHGWRAAQAFMHAAQIIVRDAQ